MFRRSFACAFAISMCGLLMQIGKSQTAGELGDCDGPDSPWLIIQRRQDGSVNFYRTWKDYSTGFGDLKGEFWLGNKNLYLLTSCRSYKLRIALEDFEGQQRYAEYRNFSVGPATDNYRLTISGYSGNAGDGMGGHNGFQFSTLDMDNDILPGQSCAQLFRGAWWYSNCHSSNLNGLYLRGNHSSYADGIEWAPWRGYYYSMKITEMKIALNS